MQTSSTETIWIKNGSSSDVTLVGKDVIAIASGVYIKFYNLITCDERIERFDNKTKGEGACCLSGHWGIPIFSMSERCINPKIFIYTYPTLNKISTCCLDTGPSSFLSSTFAGKECFLGLTSFPNFQLIVWLWRTGEKLACIDTRISSEFQRIECWINSPHLTYQFSPTLGQVCFYKIYVCSNVVSVIDVTIPLPSQKISCFSWTTDGNLLACDEFGNIWWISADGKNMHNVIKSSISKQNNRMPNMVIFRNYIVVVNSDTEMKFYKRLLDDNKKNDTVMNEDWSIALQSHPIRLFVSRHKESILSIDENGVIYEIYFDSVNKPKIKKMNFNESNYTIIIPICTEERYIVVIDNLSRFNVLDIFTGQIVEKMCLQNKHGRILAAESYSHTSAIICCTSIGKCCFIEISKSLKLNLRKEIKLHDAALDKIKFSYDASTVAIANSSSGIIFFIGNTQNEKESVIGCLKINMQIADILLYKKSNRTFRVLVLVVTKTFAEIGDKIITYTLNKSKKLLEQNEYVIQLFDDFKSLNYNVENMQEVIASPYISKQIHLISFQDDFRSAVLSNIVLSGHQLSNFGIKTDRYRIVTYGYDGIIIVRDAFDIRNVVAVFASHHYRQSGIKGLVRNFTSSGEIIVSLSCNGNLVATRLCFLDSRKNILELIKLTKSIKKETSKPNLLHNTSTEDQEKHLSNQTWLEIHDKFKVEDLVFVSMRDSMLKDVGKLKKKLKIVLDENENKTENTRLPISVFYLNEETRNLRIHSAAKERDQLKLNLEKLIKKREKIIKYLRETYWEPIQIHLCTIISFSKTKQIQNYSLFTVSDEKNCQQIWSSFFYNLFMPFEEKNSLMMSLHSTEGSEEITLKYNEDINSSEFDNTSKYNMFSFTGTTSHKWFDVETLSPLMDQMSQQINYLDAKRYNEIARSREHQLRVYFNELFEIMRTEKENEVALTTQRLERLRHCTVTLKNMFGIESTEPLTKPVCCFTEQLETIVTLEDSEIDVEPYTSLREETKAKNPNENNIQYNYEFYANALTCMMDGLLKVSTKDEIKKDIPKPNFLATKDPSKFTEMEAKAFADYKAKVEILEVERQKYKISLEEEIKEINDQMKKGIENFDEKLDKLALKKMEIQSAVLQETLLRIRAVKAQLLKLQKTRELQRIQNEELVLAEEQARKLSQQNAVFENVVIDLRNKYETLGKKDRLMEAKFRGEFADLKQPMVEHLLRHYKKRPKVGKITCALITYFTEINRSAVDRKISDLVPKEYLQFLNEMDNLDVMPNNLPPPIDFTHWQLLCKLRRAKIDIEIKMKISALELADTEQTLSAHQQLSYNVGNLVLQLQHLYDDLKLHNQQCQDIQIQMVVKTGQIESLIDSYPNYFDNSIVILYNEINQVNEAIIEAGKMRLDAIRKSVDYRKIILSDKWKHKRMRMTVEDLIKKLNVVKTVKITKLIQDQLRNDDCGTNQCKDMHLRERFFSSVHEKCKKTLTDEKERLKKITRAIAEECKNTKLLDVIVEGKKSKICELSHVSKDEIHKRATQFQEFQLHTIMKINNLKLQIKNNYEDLIITRAQLELLRLKTYPTLKFKYCE